MSKIAVMAFSGGMDSTGLLVHLLANDYAVHTLSYNYGQKHKLELDRAKQILLTYLKIIFKFHTRLLICNQRCRFSIQR